MLSPSETLAKDVLNGNSHLLRRQGGGVSAPRSVHVPALGAPIPTEFYQLSDVPDEQVEQTIALMTRFALESADSAPVIAEVDLALRALSEAPQPPTAKQIIAALYRQVRYSCRFERDEPKAPAIEASAGLTEPVVEVVLRPAEMIRLRRGDCDDFSTLLAALLLCAGIPCGFVTVAADAATPADYSHVYVVAFLPGLRIPLDATPFGDVPGWEAPNAYGKRRDWPISALGFGGRTWPV